VLGHTCRGYIVRKRVLGGLTAALAMIVTLPTAAFAWGYDGAVDDGNYRGAYRCRILVSDNEQWFQYRCSVWDKRCDDKGAYVEIRHYLEPGSAAWQYSGWYRATSNAGGCGHSILTSWRKIDTGWGSRDFGGVGFRLCFDNDGRDDYCYSGTQHWMHF
jgi:hypothetical protein